MEGIGPASYYLALAKGLKKFIQALKFRHFYIGIAYFMERMSIAAGTGRDVMLAGEVLGLD